MVATSRRLRFTHVSFKVSDTSYPGLTSWAGDVVFWSASFKNVETVHLPLRIHKITRIIFLGYLRITYIFLYGYSSKHGK